MKNLSMIFIMAILANTALASGWEVLKPVGALYDKVEGPCPSHVDVMKWYDFQEKGHLTFALTNLPSRRPLDNYVRAMTISAARLFPLGQGIFHSEVNQPVPMKAEYVTDNNQLTLFLHHQGRGSMGTPWDHGYAGENTKYDLRFSDLNQNSIYQELNVVIKELRGFKRFSKKKICRYKLDN